jgi:hypothetical protein
MTCRIVTVAGKAPNNRYSIKDFEVLQLQCNAARSGLPAVTVVSVKRILRKLPYVPGKHLQ